MPDGNATTLDGHYGIGPAESEAILTEVEARYLPADASAARRRQFRAGLHLEELLLARACALGRDAAWEAFWRRYQTRLRTAARALTHEASRAEELADGLFGELFGLRTRGGERLSKLNGYMGLGSLEGWLCTLLAQAHVDRWRRERRQVSLEECAPLHTLLVPPNQQLPAAPMALRRQVATALACTLAALDAPARLLLSLHFLDGQSLAQIGALLRIHPSTVSRRLDRVLSQLRKQTRRELGRLGLRPAATDAAMHLDPRWIHLDLRQSLQVSLPAAGSGPEGARHVV
ncbi:MAG: RNA polymerase sigma factor [Terriglobales bacterium]